MKKLLLASLAGAFVLFVWGFLAWAVLPLHKSSFRPVTNEDAIVAALKSSIAAEGLYYFPAMPQETANTPADQRAAMMETWMNKQKAGPVGMIVYHPQGMDPMMAGQFIWGFVIFLVGAYIAAWFLSRSTAAASSYISRVAYCGMLGVFISFGYHIPNMNWMFMPMDHTTAMVADVVIGWLLAGLAIAAIVKTPKAETTGQ